MVRAALYITSDVPDLFTRAVNTELFEISVLDPDSSPSPPDNPFLAVYLCDHAFYGEHRDLFIKLEACSDSIVLICDGVEAEKLLKDSLVYDCINSDKPDLLKYSLNKLHKYITLRDEHYKSDKLNNELLSIGIALSAERDNTKLLNDILYKIRQITKADAGSLYLLEEIEETDEKNLLFKISHNDSNPSDFSEFRMSLNTSSIAGYVAVTSEVLNIPDVYHIPASAPYSFNESYDLATDYRSRSMLTVPMLDHHENTIGVVQLINRKKRFSKMLKTVDDVADYVEPFDAEDEHIVLALASQAAVSLENNILYTEIETLFEGFVAASVKAIESRDPTTSGHSSRVAEYSLATAERINRQKDGVFKDITFSEEQMKELRYAGLLHDFGKVGVREAVLVKAKKLYPGHLDLMKMRMTYIKKCIYADFIEHGDEKRYRSELKEADDAIELIAAADEPSISVEDPASRLKDLHKKFYVQPDGSSAPWLTDYEYELLSIKKGSLTGSERKEIESHVEHSYEFLKNIPWTSTLKRLPDIARGHHERIDGTGYPDGIGAAELDLRSRIMAVADIYDALTASDRPYKKALSPEVAIKILHEEVESNHLDGDIVDIFIKEKIYEIGVTE